MERAHARRYTRTPRQRKPPENADRMSKTILRQVAACVVLFALAMALGSGKTSSSEVVKTNVKSALTQNINLEDFGRTLEEFVSTNPALSRIFRSKSEVQTFNPSTGKEDEQTTDPGTDDGTTNPDGDATQDGDTAPDGDGTEPTGTQSPQDWTTATSPVYMTAIVKTPLSEEPADTSEPEPAPEPPAPAEPEEALPDDAYDGDAKLSVKLKMPVEGDITSPFGYRQHPTTGARTFHYGIDIAAAYGSRILAAAGGTVLETGTDRAYGKYVILDHGNGVTTFYGHCSKILVKKGKKVTGDTAVALMGSSGISTGTHLHFEIRNGEVKVNPLLNLSE